MDLLGKSKFKNTSQNKYCSVYKPHGRKGIFYFLVPKYTDISLNFAIGGQFTKEIKKLGQPE